MSEPMKDGEPKFSAQFPWSNLALLGHFVLAYLIAFVYWLGKRKIRA